MAATATASRVESLVGDLAAVRAPRGTERECQGWHQEAALRMLCNNLDPEVAEDPTRLVVYGGSGRAARSHEALRAIVAALLELESDETLLVQSGKPVGVFRTHAGAPRVLIANSLLVPRFANWDEFRRLEADPHRIERRLETRYLDEVGDDIDDAVARVQRHAADGRGVSVGLLGNAAEVFGELHRRGVRFDLVTDQTSAHDMLNGYVPAGMSLAEALELRERDPEGYVRRARETAVRHVQAMLDMQAAGSHVFDYGNNLRTEAKDAGLENAFDFPGFVPAYVRPLFCVGAGPFRWAALSGDPADIARIDRALLEEFPDDVLLQRWLRLAPDRVAFQGLPARICWLGYGDRAKAGLLFNDLVRRGEVSAPIAIGRDHLDTGSVASPFRETEAMRDGSDAIADWPILNALLSTASGASWVSVHHGGGVGIGNSIHAGLVVVADGSDELDERLSRVLTNDPGIGVARHADAGYEEAIETAHAKGLHLPMEG